MRRIGFFILLGALLLTLPGCVYVRLLKLKGQFGDLERYVRLEQVYGLALILREPILRVADVVWLLEAEPAARVRSGRHGLYQYVFQNPATADGAGVTIAIFLSFRDGKLYKVRFSREFSTALHPELIAGALKSIGQGTVDRQRHTLAASVNPADHRKPLPVPSRTEIERILGTPAATTDAEGDVILHYQYTQTQTVAQASANAPRVAVWFYFRPGQELLRRAKISFHGMSAAINFS